MVSVSEAAQIDTHKPKALIKHSPCSVLVTLTLDSIEKLRIVEFNVLKYIGIRLNRFLRA